METDKNPEKILLLGLFSQIQMLKFYNKNLDPDKILFIRW